MIFIVYLYQLKNNIESSNLELTNKIIKNIINKLKFMHLIKNSFLIFFSFFLFSNTADANIRIIDKFKNWESHFTQDGENLVCFAISMPIKKEPGNLNRAESRIFVTFRTKGSVHDEVSVTSGYPYKKDEKVNVAINEDSFVFESSDNFAWLTSKDQEIKIINLMKKKNDAKVVGMSTRGSKTTDTYSLLGFTDAYNSAKNKCKK